MMLIKNMSDNAPSTESEKPLTFVQNNMPKPIA
jgi:hypothetical protein